MSSGHLLHYFHSKDELPLRTLEWSEGRLGTERGRLLVRASSARERLDAYVGLYVPDGHRDPHRTAGGLEPLEERRRRRGRPRAPSRHRGRLAPRPRRAARRGHLAQRVPPSRPDRFTARLRALLDGFSIPAAIGLRGTGREQVMAYVREFLDESLALPAVVEG